MCHKKWKHFSPLWMGTTSPSDVTASRMMVPLTGDVCSSSTAEVARLPLAWCSLDFFEDAEDILGFLATSPLLLLLLSSSRLRLRTFGEVCGCMGGSSVVGLAWFSAAMAASPLARLPPWCWWSYKD